MLLVVRSRLLRLISCCAVLAGLGLFAFAVDMWPVGLGVGVAFVFLLYSFRQAEISDKDSERAGKKNPLIPPFRGLMSGFVSAAVAGLMLSIVSNHPLWNESRTLQTYSITFEPGFWVALILPILLGLLFVRYRRSTDNRGR